MNNKVSETYSQLLASSSNLSKRNQRLKKTFSTFYTNLSNGLFLNSNFLKEKRMYPKYPSLFPVIDSLKPFNILKIYHCTSDEVNYLLDSVTTNSVLALKTKYDLIPEKDILLDVYLQDSYFSSALTDIYPQNLYFDFTKTENFDNWIFETFNGDMGEDLKNSSLIAQLYLNILFSSNLSSSNNFYSQLTSQIILDDKLLTNFDIIDQFNGYMDSCINCFTTDINKFLIRHTYEIPLFSDYFLSNLNDAIKPTVLTITEYFSKFLKTKTDIIYNIIYYSSKILNVITSAELIKLVYSNNDFVNQNNVARFRDNLEVPIFNKLLDDYTALSFKQFLLINYYYKFWPKKFLNILQLVVKEYCVNYLKPESKTILDLSEIQGALLAFLNTTNWDNVELFLQENVTSQFIFEKIQSQDAFNFIIKLFFMDLIDSFLNKDLNPEIENYVDSIFENIFLYLKNNGQIDYKKNYFENKDMIYIFLKTFFRNQIFNGVLFSNYQTQFNNIALTALNNSTFTFSSNKLRSRTQQKISSTINKTHKLIENIYGTAAAKKILLDNISYYLA